MELKRKLNALAKRMNPQVEAYTVAREIDRLIGRISELMAYSQEKIDRSAHKKKHNELTLGQQEDNRRKAAAAEVLATQNKESDENLADQQESFDERNKLDAKSKKPVEEDREVATPAPDSLPDDDPVKEQA